MQKNKSICICVDLDGTLIRNDVTVSAFNIFIKRRFWNIFIVIAWLIRGKAYMKRMLAHNVALEEINLILNKELLKYLHLQESNGHDIFLATGCDYIYAEQIANNLGIFRGVFASNSHTNLVAKEKAKLLVECFGINNFIYIGNSTDDVYVWNKCAQSILVSPTKGALKKMKGKKYSLFRE